MKGLFFSCVALSVLCAAAEAQTPSGGCGGSSFGGAIGFGGATQGATPLISPGQTPDVNSLGVGSAFTQPGVGIGALPQPGGGGTGFGTGAPDQALYPGGALSGPGIGIGAPGVGAVGPGAGLPGAGSAAPGVPGLGTGIDSTGIGGAGLGAGGVGFPSTPGLGAPGGLGSAPLDLGGQGALGGLGTPGAGGVGFGGASTLCVPQVSPVSPGLGASPMSGAPAGGPGF